MTFFRQKVPSSLYSRFTMKRYDCSNIKLDEENFIISIDVESLFTNVPIDETLEIIKKAFF